MKIPAITGLIKRRLLVNFQIDPDRVREILPPSLRPKVYKGRAIGGICLIRLEGERPVGLPRLLGMSSENAAHRFAVEWAEPDGTTREGVYVPRRDTDSLINQLAGGRLFASEYHAATFETKDDGRHVELRMRSTDGAGSLEVVADEAEELPATSLFSSVEEASAFFEAGSIGYSPTSGNKALDGIELVTPEWSVRPLSVSRVATSFFDDRERFPEGSIEFDHALIMRDIVHEWRQVKELS